MDEQNVTNEVQPESKTLADYEKILGVGEDYTPESVLKSFGVSYLVREENGELDEIGPELEAKNTILQSLVSAQMKAKRYFEITSPFENSCIVCRGTGEIYKFKRKTVKVNCHICAGRKKIKVKCPDCKGSGRYIKKWKSGGGINVSCKKCYDPKLDKSTGEVYAQCSECRGKGKKKKIVPDHEIKSPTPCKHCQQLGFTTNKSCKAPTQKKKTEKRKNWGPTNPVISADLADKIKMSFPPKAD